MNKSSKKAGLISLVSLTLVSCISITFAWFIFNETVNVQSNNSLGVTAGSYFEMCYLKDDGTWSDYGDTMTFTTPVMTDITGDGVNFAAPYTLNASDQPLFPLLELTSDTKSGYYVEYYFKVKTDQECGLYLSSNSYVKPHGSENANTETNENLSIYGNFSCNYIAGAARVYIGEVINDVEYPRQVWIPNEYYCLYYSYGTAYFMLNGGTNSREDKYGYLSNNFTDATETTGEILHTYYTAADYINKNITVGDRLANMTTGLQNNGPCITNFVGQGVYKEKEIVVRLWIEGTDRESDSAFNQGVCDFYLEFCGIKKDAETAADIAFVNSLEVGSNAGSLCMFVGADDSNGIWQQLTSTSGKQIEYSYNGRDWYDYDYSAGLPKYYVLPTYTNPDPSQKTETVYLRIKETNGKTNTHCIQYNMKTSTYTVICPEED